MEARDTDFTLKCENGKSNFRVDLMPAFWFSPKRMNANPNKSRTLKVEMAGDAFYRKTYPKIRLQGLWLDALGFKANGRVIVEVMAPGEVRLKYIEPTESGKNEPYSLNDR